MEFLFFGLILLGVAAIFLRRGWRPALLIGLLAGGTALAGAGFWSVRSGARVADAAWLAGELPEPKRDEGFVSSETCRSCHPAQYDSWHDSFHRTMTTPATPENIKADFNGVTFETFGHGYTLERRGDAFYAKTDDPYWEYPQGADWSKVPKEVPRYEKRITMVTGSHHYQVYWVSNSYGGERYHLPFVYMIEEKRWIPREFAFMRPPTWDRMRGYWDSNCIRCHSTFGNPRYDSALTTVTLENSHAVELGIACEACHSQGGEHIWANRNPLRRYAERLLGKPDPTIIQPARLDAKRSSEVCGNCHSINLFNDYHEFEREGIKYRPGAKLEDSKVVVRPGVNLDHPRVSEVVHADPNFIPEVFWGDGSPRVSGREFSSMIESACYQKGDLSCLSCHSMHRSNPEDQLAHGMETDKACVQCHEVIGRDIPAHTRHKTGSEGASCYNCHMPYTTYGLLKAIRDHDIASPSVEATISTGRPNACNLCHLDKTLGWTNDRLREWYGTKPAILRPDQVKYSAAVHAMLVGDAGVRGLTAWAMGWEPARAASGREWLVPFLAHALNDEYPAVRFIAERSLRGIGGYERIEYDFAGPPDARASARDRVMDAWNARPLPASSADPARLIGTDGRLMRDEFDMLLQWRDERPVFLGE